MSLPSFWGKDRLSRTLLPSKKGEEGGEEREGGREGGSWRMDCRIGWVIETRVTCSSGLSMAQKTIKGGKKDDRTHTKFRSHSISLLLSLPSLPPSLPPSLLSGPWAAPSSFKTPSKTAWT